MDFKFKIEEDIEGIDFLNQNHFSLRLQMCLKKDGFLVNGQVSKTNVLLHKGDIILVSLKETSDILPTLNPIEIIYEDEYILVLYKKKNQATIPTRKYFENSLANDIMGYFSQNRIDSTIHFINRLDYLTQGLILVAKNSYVHGLFSKVKIEKKYYALVEGTMGEGTIDGAIGRIDGIKRGITEDGKEAKTGYKIKENIGNNSLVECFLYTGRTHQIRVHMASVGHPLVGDPLYGNKEGEYFLESYHLMFYHPLLNRDIIIEKTKYKEAMICQTN